MKSNLKRSNNFFVRNFILSRHQVMSFIGQYPALALPIFRLLPRYSNAVIHKHTDLVIEGFPRSANTFAVIAFKLAQDRSVNLAHHLHMPFQIKQAIKWKIPTLVIIRNPLDSISSLITRNPSLPIRQALKDYIRFFRVVDPLTDHIVVASFDEVTTDFGGVIRRINKFYETNFGIFEHNTKNVEQVIKQIENVDIADKGSGKVTETTVARPSKNRGQQYSQIRNRILEHSKLQNCANTLYQKITGDQD